MSEGVWAEIMAWSGIRWPVMWVISRMIWKKRRGVVSRGYSETCGERLGWKGFGLTASFRSGFWSLILLRSSPGTGMCGNSRLIRLRMCWLRR